MELQQSSTNDVKTTGHMACKNKLFQTQTLHPLQKLTKMGYGLNYKTSNYKTLRSEF